MKLGTHRPTLWVCRHNFYTKRNFKFRPRGATPNLARSAETTRLPVLWVRRYLLSLLLKQFSVLAKLVKWQGKEFHVLTSVLINVNSILEFHSWNPSPITIWLPRGSVLGTEGGLSATEPYCLSHMVWYGRVVNSWNSVFSDVVSLPLDKCWR